MFAWVVKRCGLSSSALHASLGRAVLAVWLRKLDLRSWGERDSPDVPSVNEGMLDWIVFSVESGWTPKEVLLWIFPSFWGLLFDLIKDGGGSM